MAALPRTLVASLLAAALALGGCTTAPISYFKGPPTAAVARSSLPEALNYLDAARAQYQSAVEAQMRAERDLTNLLVGGGALIMALALGQVSSNAIAGTALLGGTVYTLGNVNLPRSRVLVHLAGVEALSCTQKAVSPLYVSSPQLSQLRAALDALRSSLPALSAALVGGRALSPETAAGNADAPALLHALKVGKQVQQAAEASLASGRDLLQASDRAARELVAAVNGIDEAVVRSLVNATPELSAVPGLVAGLAGISGSFAPGAGVDKLLVDGLNEALPGAKNVSGKKSDFLLAADEIIDAARATAALAAAAQGLLPRKSVPWPEDAFKHCGVAQLVAALTASTSSLQFTAGVDARQSFEIHGGVKPYFVRVDGPTVDGLTVTSPIRFDNQAEVSVVGSKVPALQTQLRVVDSSPTARPPVLVTLVVASAALPASAPVVKPASGAASGADPGPSANNTASVEADLNKLKQKGQFKFAGKTFTLSGVPVRNGDAIEVSVNCADGDPKNYRRADLVKALLAAAGIAEPPLRDVRIKTRPAGCAAD